VDVATLLLSKKRAKSLVGGSRAIAIGDSITNGQDTTEQATNRLVGGMSWFNQACVLSRQKLRYLRNSGVSGETSTEMLARFKTTVVDYSPDICFIMCGTNDNAAGITAATTLANIQSMHLMAEAAGVRTVLCTIPPRGNIPVATINAINDGIRDYAAKNSLMVCDFYEILCAPDAAYVAAYAADGVHPNYVGSAVMGKYVVDNIVPHLPFLRPTLAMSENGNDTLNLLAGGMFLVDTNVDGLADGWIAAGTGTVTFSLVADTEGHGNFQELNRTVSDGNSKNIAQIVSTGFSVGDVLSFAGRVQIEVDSDADPIIVEAAMLVRDSGNAVVATLKPLYDWRSDCSEGTFYGELTVPATADDIRVQFTVAGGTGKARFGQVTIRNLTDQGLR
jgi:lysophospholipase L1-like esterase